VPGGVSDFFKAVHMYGNPYKLPEAERGDWAKGLDLPRFSGHEYLFFVGCPGSFDERGQKMARAVAGLLKRAGASFGILGEDEVCDGNEVRTMGETGLFEMLAQKNIAKWKELGVEKIVTLSPHAYHAIKNHYPFWGGAFQVLHYPQLLAGITGDLKFPEPAEKLWVTFHDPCYLGRHNMDYFTPRAVLGSVPGIELVEMDGNRADALCCGGGGGNFFTDILGGGPDSSSRVRVRQARRTGAGVIAVACPKCAKMLEDALKAEDLDDELKVMDLAEIVMERMN